ncbi:MAG: competence/damage-inducible protein A [Myxococcota bacterium]
MAAEAKETERTAAMLVIGNEVLTGKVHEANVAVVARLFFELGIRLRRVVVCVDEIDVIAEDVRSLARSHDVLITSGGIGPTHDDVTYDGVAAAFGREIERNEGLERMLRAYHEKKDLPVTEAQLRMANVVKGSRLLQTPAHPWPTMVVENVYVLPGVPQIFRLKMPLLRADLDHGERLFSESVYTRCREGEIASLLEELEGEHPAVAVGSYLNWDDSQYTVLVTFDSRNETQALRAAQKFVDAIGDKFVSREAPA